MTDLISKDKVLDILKNLGGCDAQDEYSNTKRKRVKQ